MLKGGRLHFDFFPIIVWLDFAKKLFQMMNEPWGKKLQKKTYM